MSPGGKPDENGRSASPCVIIVVNKTDMFSTPKEGGPDIWETELKGKEVIDVFYFCKFPRRAARFGTGGSETTVLSDFYPYNLGNTVGYPVCKR